MINQEQMLNDFATLPPAAQRQLLDFMAFLQSRYAAKEIAAPVRPTSDLRQEPFVGMWRDREEMSDSAGWVRRLREKEWQ